MLRSDFIAHQGLSNVQQSDIQIAIQAAEARSHKGHFVVVETNAGTILTLPEMSVSLRNDIAQVHYDTEAGYSFNVAG
tara:strand:+ start:9565 stop:9798 length:234 start_codon:yes stop_codon:yes gene_type:complete